MIHPKNKTLLFISAHPDDSGIGAPATLALMRNQGWDVTDFCCSLGGTDPSDQHRRHTELTEACRRAGIRSVVASPVAALNSRSHPERYEESVTAQIKQKLHEIAPAIVIAPHAHDLHPGHEVAARATLAALATIAYPPVLWCWNIWGDLPFPSLYVPFGQQILDEALYALEAYDGELARMPYGDMVKGRALLSKVQGAEKVFHFGANIASEEPFAETLLEIVPRGGKWLRGTPRVLNAEGPFAEPTGIDMSWWLSSSSPLAELRNRGRS